LHKADLLRTILHDVYLLHSDLSEANLRGADLRRADLSGAYLKDTTLSEANLSEAYFLETYLIRTKLEGAELTGCCIHGWHLEEVDLSTVNCRYLFTQFNYATKSPSYRYPASGDLQPGELALRNTRDIGIEVRFPKAPNWEALVFTLTQVKLESPDILLTIKSYEFNDGDYVLRLSANQIVNTKLVSQRILQLYPKILERFLIQRQTILNLLNIKENPESKIKPLSRSSVLPPPPGLADRRRRMYQEVINQIERIIISQAPDQFVESVQRLLDFLKQQNISTEEIQKKVIVQAIMKRVEQDEIFQKLLLHWEGTADEAARFSIVGQAVRLAIALILSQGQPS